MIKNLVLKELKKSGINAKEFLEIPPEPKMGDFALPCFKLAKKKESPVKAAERTALKIRDSNIFKKIEVIGPYVNIFLSDKVFTNALFSSKKRKEKKGKVIIEHTSVNPGKPWHVGHSRNALLGDVIAKCYKELGHNIEIQNYIDNLGRQVAVTTWAYNNIKNINRKKGMKLDLWQGLMYARASTKAENSQKTEQEIVEIMKLMEESENKTAEKAKEISVDSVKSQLETAFRLGIFYDLLVWESDIVGYKLFEKSLKEMLKSKSIYKVKKGEDKDCIVVDMSKAGKEFADQKKSYKIIVRSNGIPTYTGKDIAYQLWKLGVSKIDFKYKEFITQPNGEKLWTTWPIGKNSSKFGKANVIINVIGYEQEFPQKVVKEAVKIMGYKEGAENSYHLSYKHIRMPEGKFSGRSGNWVGKHADAVISRVVELAKKELKKRNPKISKKELEKMSELIGIGAFKFFVLKFDPNRTITFEWDRLLDFNGFTSVYVQYSGVRAKKILEKKRAKAKKIEFTKDVEKELVKLILDYDEIIENVVKTHKSHLLVEYTHNLATKFNEFYAKCKVIGSEHEESRLNIVNKYLETLAKSMNLLGITVPDYL